MLRIRIFNHHIQLSEWRQVDQRVLKTIGKKKMRDWRGNHWQTLERVSNQHLKRWRHGMLELQVGDRELDITNRSKNYSLKKKKKKDSKYIRAVHYTISKKKKE